MPDLVVAAFPNTCVASLGAVLDAHSRLGALYENNRALSDYSKITTRIRVLTVDGGPVRLAGGRVLASDGAFASAGEPRLVYLAAIDQEVFSGGVETEALSDWLRQQHARGAVLAAAGASVWALAQAGLLKDAKVCVEPRVAPAFRQTFPRLEIDAVRTMSPTGQVMTCGALAFEREFVTRVFGHAVSPGVGQWLRRCWGSLGEAQAPQHADPLVAQAQLWIQERFTESFRIGDLAAKLSVSHQTLIRRFQQIAGVTPREYAQGLRIQAARMMLAETTRTVAEIAALVGYSDVPTFRAVFQARVGETPSAFRLTARP